MNRTFWRNLFAAVVLVVASWAIVVGLALMLYGLLRGLAGAL